MRLLVDTHIAFWLVGDRASLSPAERKLADDPDNELFVSAVSIWELRLKWSRLHRSGDPKGPIDPMDALIGLQRLGMPILPLDAEIAARPLSTPMTHKDPFDELLLTVAQENGLKLLTRDDDCSRHPLAYRAR